jgi:hypothetical protein
MSSTPSDISLAVGDGVRRMTYVELAAVRGTSLAAARRLVLRHRWPRQVGNDGVVRVSVPLTEIKKPAKAKAMRAGVSHPTTSAVSDLTVTTTAALDPPTDPAVTLTDSLVVTLSHAVETLREQLERERTRADHAEHRIEEELARVDALYAALGEERRRVIAILTDQRARPWWRRWFR